MKRDHVLRTLRGHGPLALPATTLTRAAVLVPLRPIVSEPDALEIVLTRRSDQLEAHSGQVAFPGGRIDATDASPEAAALREAHEELGLAASEVELVGRLSELYTGTGYHVIPVVGLVDVAARLTPSPHEVARVFSVPLTVLLERERWATKQYERGGARFTLWHLPYDGEDIWGATALVLRGMVELLWAL